MSYGLVIGSALLARGVDTIQCQDDAALLLCHHYSGFITKTLCSIS